MPGRQHESRPVDWADVVITMGCGDECPYVPGKRYIDWELDDPPGQPLAKVREVRDEIARRIDGVLAELSESKVTS